MKSEIIWNVKDNNDFSKLPENETRILTVQKVADINCIGINYFYNGKFNANLNIIAWAELPDFDENTKNSIDL